MMYKQPLHIHSKLSNSISVLISFITNSSFFSLKAFSLYSLYPLLINLSLSLSLSQEGASMEVYSIVVFFFSFLTLFSHHCTFSATLVVDGVSQWNHPTVQVGDSIIFRHKYDYNLYIFKNRRAFNMCNFTEATLLTHSTSTFTWHPSRLGSFYFSFNNGSTKPCADGQKLAIEVSSSTTPENFAPPPVLQPPAAAPEAAPPVSGGGNIVSPSPGVSGDVGNYVSSPPSPGSSGAVGGGGGGIVSSSPAYPWPNRPEELASPGPSPMNAIFPASGKGGSSGPFINSNPAVPLPTGEVDSANIRPVHSSSDRNSQVVGFVGVVRALCFVTLPVLFQKR